MRRKLLLLFLSTATLLPAADSLSEAAAKRGIRIGAAVQSGYVANEPAYAATLAREYSMIEPEYEMLWSTVHPSRASSNFSGSDKADKIYSWEVVNEAVAGTRPRGHRHGDGRRLPVDAAGNASASNLAIQSQLYGRVVSACMKFP